MGVTPPAGRPVILVVTHNFIRDREDQAGQFIYTLIRPLCERYRFIVVAPHAAGLAEREQLDGIEVIRFRYGPDAEETLAYVGNMHEQVFASWKKRWLFLRFLRSMRQTTLRLAADEKPQAVHIHWWVPGALAVAGALARRSVPYVLTTHGSDVTLMDKFAWLRPLGCRLFRRASACTAVSSYLRDRLRDLTGVEATVLPMPYDDVKFAPQPPPAGGPPVVTCIGRFVERKGQHVLLDAARILRDRGTDLRIRLVGDGPDRPRLEAQAERLEIADRVQWPGNIPHSEIPAAIASSTVVVLPSVRDWKGEVEGLGMVLAEASACGRPVIGTDLAGVKDAVAHEESGLLVPPNDATALADAIDGLLADPARAARLGHGGIEFARRNFSPSGQAGKLAVIFERVGRR